MQQLILKLSSAFALVISILAVAFMRGKQSERQKQEKNYVKTKAKLQAAKKVDVTADEARKELEQRARKL